MEEYEKEMIKQRRKTLINCLLFIIYIFIWVVGVYLVGPEKHILATLLFTLFISVLLVIKMIQIMVEF